MALEATTIDEPVAGWSAPHTAVPSPAEIIGAFGAGPDDRRESHPLRRLAAELARRHRGQWEAEDVCRNNAADDQTVAEMKRAIDAMNATRVSLVDEIDAWADEHVSCDGDGTLHTETLGQLVDRLAVAWVRREQLTQSAVSDPARRPDADRAQALLEELGEAYSHLARDLAAGRRRLPRWRSLKRYGNGSR